VNDGTSRVVASLLVVDDKIIHNIYLLIVVPLILEAKKAASPPVKQA
jgi:hypothetical protein